jgi:hypothetical protein
MSKRYTEAEQQQAVERLKEILPEGSTVHTVLRHVSQSGMLRRIDLYRFVAVPPEKKQWEDDPDVQILWLTGDAARVLNLRRHRDREGLEVGGCGMDMGFHVVYELARRLFGDGYALNQKWL